MHLVHDELERQKVDFVKKEEVLQKREDALRDKDLAMQESLIGFSRFLQEQEIIVVEDALRKLEDRRTVVLVQLERMMMYQKYLEGVLEKATQFHELHDLMLRHATLEASQKELKRHIADCEGEMEKLRQELQQYLKNSANNILTLNNDVSITRQIYERKRLQTADLQKNIDSMLETSAARTLARSQVCMAAENLFYRIDKASIIARPVQDNPIKNLDMAADFITDLAFIQKAYRLELAKKQTPTPRGG
ncbi:hypothetical protein M758_3G205800 [Ceratodon purpureus]|nr:hypothetical protein M758_3G205800 [Ceratodon purpureus]